MTNLVILVVLYLAVTFLPARFLVGWEKSAYCLLSLIMLGCVILGGIL